MKAIKTTYIVVIENEECKKAKFACPSGYFIREIRVA